MLRDTFCKWGFHKWDKEPFVKDYLVERLAFLFWSTVDQTGVTKCSNPACHEKTAVKRDGIAGSGGKASKWKPISFSERKEITPPSKRREMGNTLEYGKPVIEPRQRLRRPGRAA